MKINAFPLLIFTLGCFAFCAHSSQPQFSGINNIRFHNAEFNNDFAGNGFLLNYQGKLYGITVKHTLFEARHKQMKTVQLQPWVRDWRIHPLQSPEQYVLLGELVNASPDERINMKIMQSDWLVFEVTENHSTLTPVNLRQTPLEPGEILTAYGCSYAKKHECQQDEISGEFIANEGHNLRIIMPDLNIGNLRGMSGSPVLDEDFNLVGIVSNVLPSKSNEGMDFAPASLDYLLQILQKIQ